MISHLDNKLREIRRLYDKHKEWKEKHTEVEKTYNPFSGAYSIVVYTNVKDFSCGYRNVEIKPCSFLSTSLQDWINKTTLRLCDESTKSEKKFSLILKECNYDVVEQPYFRIGEKGYFLDFYIPSLYIAIELNGSVHRGKNSENYDWDRDIDFMSIGVRTLRLSNSDIEEQNFKDKLPELINELLEGNPDPARYYYRSDTNKFDHRETVFQKVHKAVIEVLKSCPEKSRILLRTDQTYFCKVFHLIDQELNCDCFVNNELMRETNTLVRDKKIVLDTIYSGSYANLRPRMKEFLVEKHNHAIRCYYTYMFDIVGSELVKLDSIDEMRNLFRFCVKDGVCTTKCPRGVYAPERINKKNEVIVRRLRIGTTSCSLCKYNKGDGNHENNEDMVKCCVPEGKYERNYFELVTEREHPSETMKDNCEFVIKFRQSDYYKKLVEILKNKNQ